MLGEPGKQALYKLRGWRGTLTDRNMPVYRLTVEHYNWTLGVLEGDAGLELTQFEIEPDEFRRPSSNRPGDRAGKSEMDYVVWDVFMPKLAGAIGYVEERVATLPNTTVQPPLPREALRPVLRQLVDAHYQRPPTGSRSFSASRTDNGVSLYLSDQHEESILDLAWKQINELQDGGYITFYRGRSMLIEDAGMEAYKEIVRLEEADRSEGQTIERRAPMNNKVWVIHGHDYRARDVIFSLLTAVGLQPLEFDQAAELTGKPSPSIMEILRAAFREGQAFVALFTPDEEAVPSAAFADTDEPGPHPQPRPNVVLEAGMAFAYDPDRTIIVEMGRIREISDLGGIHTVKWRHDRYETRKAFLRKLKLAKCPVNDSGDLWVRAGGAYPLVSRE